MVQTTQFTLTIMARPILLISLISMATAKSIRLTIHSGVSDVIMAASPKPTHLSCSPRRRVIVADVEELSQPRPRHTHQTPGKILRPKN